MTDVLLRGGVNGGGGIYDESVCTIVVSHEFHGSTMVRKYYQIRKVT